MLHNAAACLNDGASDVVAHASAAWDAAVRRDDAHAVGRSPAFDRSARRPRIEGRPTHAVAYLP